MDKETQKKFGLRILEVINHQEGSPFGRVLRGDFSAEDDDGKYIVTGAWAYLFPSGMSPIDLCDGFRSLADNLEKWWATHGE